MSERAQFISYGGPERREEILAAKRKRYREDEAYRKAIRDRSRASYQAKSSGRRPRRGRNRPKPYMWPDGKLTVLIGLGQLADMCGVTKQAIKRYEERGVIPINRLIDHRKRRWYPLEFASFLVPFFQDQAKRRIPLLRLSLRVEQAWQQALNEGTVHILPREREYGKRYRSRDDSACTQDSEDRTV